MNAARYLISTLSKSTAVDSSFNNLRISTSSLLQANDKVQKRPPSAFLLFYQSKLPEIKASHQNAPNKVTAWSKTAGSMWKDLAESDKERYKDISAAQKKEYFSQVSEEEIAAKKAASLLKRAKKQKRKIKTEARDLNKPKRPASAHGLYIREKITGSSSNEQKSVFIQFSKDWKALSDAQRSKYVMEASKNKTTYNKQLIDWEDKMLADGRSHLVRVSRLNDIEAAKQATKKPLAAKSTKTKAKK